EESARILSDAGAVKITERKDEENGNRVIKGTVNDKGKEQKAEIGRLNASYSDLDQRYNQLQAASGSQLDKLSTDLGNKQAALNQKDARLRQLEAILMRQDSILSVLNNSVKNALLGFNP
ncbi:UNVERIFIED_CONTAM: hypothetical protein IGO34_25535, partial [Salmonella enterica subsp. enterica serovar Weltevreden]